MIVLKRLCVENFKSLERVDLVFPRQGSVLVEGLNEAGKSTLFESVYYALYGVPLVTEGRGRGNLESAIRYGADSMSVELSLEVDETVLEVRRSVRRGRASLARLSVRNPGAPEEEVTGVLAVNARIVGELGGLDGEALLNSCFVEQKKLSKLEDLAAAQRKDSLRKLLNLDRLTALAERFRITPQDERELAAARARLELAEVAAALPAMAAERSSLEGALRGTGDGARGTGNGARGGIDALAGRARGLPAEASIPGGAGRPAEASIPGHGDLDASEEVGWEETAAKLGDLRARSASARRAGVLLAGASAVVFAVALVTYLAGAQLLSWIVPVAFILALLSWRSTGRGRDLRREIAPLEEELSGRRDVILEQSGELEGRRRRAEQFLGVESDELGLQECGREVDRLSRQIEVKRSAGAIVEGAMERMVRMVLPSTERNLGQILPLLTAGRYHEARIAEDYQIQVWDDAAGRYVSKSIFSGGARDQFSLALRLAFALATLPEELGTTPGFIFLDEPLSSFDGPRTEALVRLLTEGQIAANFSQIFVISHNSSFDPNAFEYRLVMRDGRVVESNLRAEG
ncbi:MAG TPA: AAA family ATPase [Chloroflexota bacterium]